MVTTVESRLSVAPGLPSGWSEWVAGVSVTALPRWIRLNGGRLPGQLLRFSLGDSSLPAVTFCGTVLESAPADRRIDPHAVLAGGAAVDGLVPEGPHPWGGRPSAGAYPAALMMLPNYESFPVGPGADSREALRRTVEGLVGWCAERGLRTLSFLYLTPEAGSLVRVLRELGFDVLPMTSSCELHVTWDDFDGYLASLPRKRRTAVRRELRSLAECEVVVHRRELASCAPRLAELRCALVEKYGGAADLERETARLRRVASLFSPEEITVLVAERDGEPLGFTLFLRDGRTWTAYLTGADYTANTARLAYFATSYYRPAELAPQLGVERIGYGLGSWEAKRWRGCGERPLWAAGTWLGQKSAGVGS